MHFDAQSSQFLSYDGCLFRIIVWLTLGKLLLNSCIEERKIKVETFSLNLGLCQWGLEQNGSRYSLEIVFEDTILESTLLNFNYFRADVIIHGDFDLLIGYKVKRSV